MLPSSIDFGPISIHLYGLIIAIAILLGWYLAKKRARKYKIPLEIFDDPILLIPLFLSIIGARIYHVVDLWSVYKHDPISVFYLANGGLGIWGAIAGLLIGLLIVSKVRKIELLPTLDLIAPSLLLGQSIGRFGNYINQEGFGPPTNLPWGVFIEKVNRPQEFISSTNFHPTFFYEAILNFLFFLILLKVSVRLKKKGQMFALYLIFYSLIRFAVEFWRIDTWTIGKIQVAHAVAIASLLIGLWLFSSVRKTLDRS